MSAIEKQRFLRLVAELLAGVQVPGSMGALGEGMKPWMKLRNQLALFGWNDADEIEQAIHRLLFHTSGITVKESPELPDGSGVATVSFPLPIDHWIYDRAPHIPPMGLRAGVDNAERMPLSGLIREAARYAVRDATANGTIPDFDPDALVQAMTVGLLGYHTADGTSEVSDNPDPLPSPILEIIR